MVNPQHLERRPVQLYGGPADGLRTTVDVRARELEVPYASAYGMRKARYAIRRGKGEYIGFWRSYQEQADG